ncbi:MAG TPA: hypothetical protein VD996_06410 [Chitinophagaceae bacterium]|nr:hypothetical protein [Chitinophagaceae bacterium]
MKRRALASLFVASALGLMAFTDGILKKLELSEREAQEAIFGNFTEGNLYFPRTSAMKKLALGQREQLVQELGAYIKNYVQSPQFAQQYQEARLAAKPEGPAEGADLLKSRIAQLEEDIKRAEEELKKTTGDMRKLHEFSLKTMKDELKALKDPKDPRHKDYLEQAGEMNGFDEDNYKMQLEEYEKNFPPTVNQLVKTRLQEFLALTKDIDFNAKLIDKNGKKVFADPALEAKDALWKRCFRAGPEAIKAARKFAQDWLASLK